MAWQEAFSFNYSWGSGSEYMYTIDWVGGHFSRERRCKKEKKILYPHKKWDETGKEGVDRDIDRGISGHIFFAHPFKWEWYWGICIYASPSSTQCISTLDEEKEFSLSLSPCRFPSSDPWFMRDSKKECTCLFPLSLISTLRKHFLSLNSISFITLGGAATWTTSLVLPVSLGSSMARGLRNPIWRAGYHKVVMEMERGIKLKLEGGYDSRRSSLFQFPVSLGLSPFSNIPSMVHVLSLSSLSRSLSHENRGRMISLNDLIP